MLAIKEAIKEKGYTVTSLAEKLGMKQVSLSRIINGNPTVETLDKIAKAIDVDIRDLFISPKSIKKDTIYVLRNEKYIPIGEINLSGGIK